MSDKEDAVKYFLEHGSDEEYPTSKYFNPKWYLDINKDVKKSNINPLVHFLRFGEKEGRLYRYAKIDVYTIPNIRNKTTVNKYYEAIYDSLDFNINYYIKENKLEDITIDPIIHYILYGADKGYNPSITFNTNEYTKNDSKKVTTNPLYHYITSNNSDTTRDYLKNRSIPSNFDSKYDNTHTNNMLKHLNSNISIIIPIKGNCDELKKCIESILLNTNVKYEIILIQYETNNKINKLLKSLDKTNNIKIIKTNDNLVRSINNVIKDIDNDIVLLEVNTIVTPRWLSSLILSVYTMNHIATISPLSTFNTIDDNKIINNVSYLNKISYHINKTNENTLLNGMAVNSACLYIKHDAINKIGLFNEKFNNLNDMELDFIARLNKTNMINVIHSTLFVYNKNNYLSYDKRIKQNNILENKHPNIYSKINVFINNQVKKYTKKLENTSPIDYEDERVLYVTTENNGKIDLDAKFYTLSKKYNCFILSLTNNSISLNTYDNINKIINIKKWFISDIDNKDYFTRFYLNILSNLKIDLIYNRNFTLDYSDQENSIDSYMHISNYLEIPIITLDNANPDKMDSICEDLLNPSDSLTQLIKENENFIDFDNKKVAVYTALTENDTHLITPSFVDDNFDYICFTDNPDVKSPFWQIKYMDDITIDKTRKAEIYKINSYKYLAEYDYTIYVDPDLIITDNIRELINNYSKNKKLFVFSHEKMDCIYKLADESRKKHLDSPNLIGKQTNRYKKEGYPTHNGLSNSGFLFRDNHDKEIIKLMKQWYDEVIKYSFIDDLSFSYICWKNNYEYDECPLLYSKNTYFQQAHYKANKIELSYNITQIDNILDAMDKKTTIIIPIYNAYEQTKTCIESVLEHTNIPYELLLINDCSPDKRIDKLLEYYKNNEKIKIINNKTNQGFVKNINIGHDSTDNDVLWLNSDTIVTPKWLQKLKSTAYSDPKIATVTPLSNNAGAFSVPEIGEKNPIDEKLGINATANIIEKISDNTLIDTPTGNGFCMYVKREAINDVGNLDLTFGQGYGEENDFCMRLKNAGWKNVIDTSTYIIHDESASFGKEKEKLIKKHRKYIDRKHPTYKRDITKFIESETYANVRKQIKQHLNSEDNKEFDRKRVLYVIHEGTGGTLYTNVDLMKHVNEEMDTYVVTASLTRIQLLKYNSYSIDKERNDEFINQLHLLANWNLKKSYTIEDIRIEEFRHIYFNIIKALHIDIVHIRHLIRHSFDIPYIAKALGIPVVLSFHDFYYVCISHNLLDDNKKYCAGHCTPLSEDKDHDNQCDIIYDMKAPIVKKYIDTWRKEVQNMFDCCDVYVTTSQSTYDIYTEFYPELSDRDFKIIEHGRDLKTPDKIDVPKISKDKPIKIVIPGNINLSKGALFIKEFMEYDVDNRLELHFVGDVNDMYRLDEVGILEGKYKRSEFCKKVHGIKPHAMGIFSIWPETYCHTLTESWSCGYPVISIDIGALGERIKNNGGGFLVSLDPERTYEQIIDYFNDEEKYIEVANQIPNIKFKSTKEMSEEYMEIYKDLIDN